LTWAEGISTLKRKLGELDRKSQEFVGPSTVFVPELEKLE
jgi:hypothetical protein